MYEEPIMQFFEYAHLPEHLQKVSKPFGEIANEIVATLPRNAERSTALRKLLEAKDCAVRATFVIKDGVEWSTKVPETGSPVVPDFASTSDSPFANPNMSARSGMGLPKR